jgi:hypothetical protein
MTMGDRIKRKTWNYVDEVNDDSVPSGQPLSVTPRARELNWSPCRLTGPGAFPARSTHP